MPVKAENKTIVVPDDYPTIASAIGNATNGDTIFVRNGTYEGEIDKTLVIDKSISIIGESTNTTLNLHPKYSVWWILTAMFSSSEDALQITARDVTVANLTIKYTGDIRVSNEKVQFLRTNLDASISSSGLIISGSGCTLAENSLGGLLKIYSSSNIISQNKMYSLYVESGNNNTIESNDLHYLSLTNSNYNLISKNSINTENIWRVVDIVNSSYNTLVRNNVTSHLWNTNLVISGKSYDNTIYENNFLSPAYAALNSSEYFYSNKEFVSVDLAAFGNFWEQNGVGNYWQNYHGSDANWDGIGDTAYVIDATNVDHYPLIAPSYETKSGLDPLEI